MQENLLNQVNLNFSPESLIVLNIILGLVMFGLALELKVHHFKDLLKTPRAYIAGLISQFMLLALVSFLLIMVVNPSPD